MGCIKMSLGCANGEKGLTIDHISVHLVVEGDSFSLSCAIRFDDQNFGQWSIVEEGYGLMEQSVLFCLEMVHFYSSFFVLFSTNLPLLTVLDLEPYVKEIVMDSMFNVLLWCLQILTAGILLLQTCFDLFYTIAEKRRKQQPPPARIPHQPPEASLSIPIQETQSQDKFFV